MTDTNDSTTENGTSGYFHEAATAGDEELSGWDWIAANSDQIKEYAEQGTSGGQLARVVVALVNGEEVDDYDLMLVWDALRKAKEADRHEWFQSIMHQTGTAPSTFTAPWTREKMPPFAVLVEALRHHTGFREYREKEPEREADRQAQERDHDGQ